MKASNFTGLIFKAAELHLVELRVSSTFGKKRIKTHNLLDITSLLFPSKVPRHSLSSC